MSHADYTPDQFHQNPLMFYYEVTLACDLVCKHCRASAQECAHPEELSHAQAKALIDQVASFPRPPMMVFTGGDPLKRPDLFDLLRHAVGRGIRPALTPSATPLATYEAFRRAREAGVGALGISLDGADAPTHDAFRGFEGSFDRTLEMLDNARKLGMAVQVNTTITRRNVGQVDAMAELLGGRGIAMCAVFFLVPVGRGVEEERIGPEQYEEVFARLWHHAQRRPYAVKTTEAPHYRRFVLQKGGDPLAGPQGETAPEDSPKFRGPTEKSSHHSTAEAAKTGRSPSRLRHRAPLGVGDGKGVMFVSHTGEIFPAGFLPLRCGRFPLDSVVETYQNHPTFQALRNPDGFKGRCGYCEYRYVCGGSRARAYALTGDPLATEPDCVYIPDRNATPIR